MKLYRTKWNVLGDDGKTAAPGGLVKLAEESAQAQAALGSIEPEPVGDAPALSGDDRAAALLAYVPKLAVGDFTNAGQLRAEARRRIAAELGFEPADEEIRIAGEAFAKAQNGNA